MSAEMVWRELPTDTRDPAAAASSHVPTGATGTTIRLLGSRPTQRRFWPFGSGEREAVGLRRDLAHPFAAPSAGMPITIIEIDGRELADLLVETGERSHAVAAMSCRYRRVLARRRIGRCMVAMASGVRPCFVQFLLDHTDNQALRRAFGDAFPHLMRDEALLEAPFTPATYSLERIMPAAMARIAAKAEAMDVRWIHSFVQLDRAATLGATIAAGFAVHQWRRQQVGLFGRSTTFGPLPEDLAWRLGT